MGNKLALREQEVSLEIASLRQLVRSFAQEFRMSSREIDVLVAASSGLTNKEVADKLGCAAGTVDALWSRIRRKSGTQRRNDVLAMLLRYRLSMADKSAEP